MPVENYKETFIVGDQFQRANKIVIENPLDGMPRVTIAEEKVTNLPDDEKHKVAVGAVDKSIDDLTETFPIVDPETGEFTGSRITFGEAYEMVYSVYWYMVRQRDNPRDFDMFDAVEGTETYADLVVVSSSALVADALWVLPTGDGATASVDQLDMPVKLEPITDGSIGYVEKLRFVGDD